MTDSSRRRSPRFSTGGGAAGSSRPSVSGRRFSASSGAGAHAGRSGQPRVRPAAHSPRRPAPAPVRGSRARQAAGMQSLAAPRSRSQREAARRGGHSSKAPVIAGIAAAALVVVMGLAFVISRVFGGGAGQDSLPNRGEQVEVVIDDGSGANAVAAKLKDAGVIANTDDFITQARKQKADSQLKSGAYVFTVGQDIDSIISQLISGPNSTSGRLTIPEGLTVPQTARLVSEALSVSSDDFIAQAKASNYVADYPFLANAADDSLEGFLCPKTYDFSGRSDVTADAVIRAMLDQYNADVASLDFASGEALIADRYGITMSDYDVIKLASIVEREAVTDGQRPKVASVFFNRLKAGMALQSDATMMYVTGGEVTADDLKTESPYNTYLNAGLTPTPICTPSVDSIKAVLSPDDTDYLYFYITQTDEWFSSTYDEHLQAIEENR